jgi:hypothetical protein
MEGRLALSESSQSFGFNLLPNLFRTAVKRLKPYISGSGQRWAHIDGAASAARLLLSSALIHLLPHVV